MYFPFCLIISLIALISASQPENFEIITSLIQGSPQQRITKFPHSFGFSAEIQITKKKKGLINVLTRNDYTDRINVHDYGMITIAGKSIASAIVETKRCITKKRNIKRCDFKVIIDRFKIDDIKSELSLNDPTFQLEFVFNDSKKNTFHYSVVNNLYLSIDARQNRRSVSFEDSTDQV
jgi:hypothetical protein